MDHDTFIATFVANWLAAVSARRYMQNGNRFPNHPIIIDESRKGAKIVRDAGAAWAIYQAGVRAYKKDLEEAFADENAAQAGA